MQPGPETAGTGTGQGGVGIAPTQPDRAPFPERAVSSRPRAILFDAGNTLVFLDGRRMRTLFAEAGVRVGEERFAEAELNARAELVDSMDGSSTGLEPAAWKRYFRRIFRSSGVPWWRMPRIARALEEAHSLIEFWSHVEDGTPAALQRVLDDGYRLAVISNADGTMEGLLETVGLRPYFEFVLDSGTVAWEKPDPRIFREGVERMGVEPHEALYVGDLYHIDVLGARAAGMEAVLLDPLDRLVHDVDRIPSVSHLPQYLAGRSSSE